MSDDSDVAPRRRVGGRRRPAVPDDESSSDADSDSPGSPVLTLKQRKRIKRLPPSDQENDDSDSSFGRAPPSKRSRRNYVPESDSEDSSGSSIVVTRRRKIGDAKNLNFDTSSSVSEAESNGNNGSDSSDGSEDSRSCPICLVRIKKQEVGSPDVCNHFFCLECILEWSKKVRTCPVDRQPFSIILSRPSADAAVSKAISVDEPAPEPYNPESLVQNVDDMTFCEICNSPDDEDTMLLCDACNLGYHTACLDPPLDRVPDGMWVCPTCGDDQDFARLRWELEMLENRFQNRMGAVPRTRHAERVRSAVRRKRKSRRRRRPRVRVSYEVDPATGETVAVETRVKARRRRRKAKRKEKRPAATVKQRLAARLGLCRSKKRGSGGGGFRGRSATGGSSASRGHNTNSNTNNNNSVGRNTMMALNQLDITGRYEDFNLIDFADSDSETETLSAFNPGGGGVMARARRPTQSDVQIFRRAARRKAIVVPDAPSSSTNVLGEILAMMQPKYPIPSSDNKKIDFSNKHHSENSVRRRPNYGNNSNSDSGTPNSTRVDDNNRNVNNNENVVASSTTSDDRNTGEYNSNVAVNGDEDKPPVESTFDSDNWKKEEDSKSRSSTPNNKRNETDSDLDIYSDIETVSTSRVEELPTVQLNPSEPNLNTDDDNNSDIDLVIDTEKQEEVKEQVSSSADVGETPSSVDNVQLPHSTTEIQNETISTLNEDKDEEEESDEEGCPNFSIYSKESINMVKTIDFDLPEKSSEKKKSSMSEENFPMSSHVPTYSKDAPSSSKSGNLPLYSDSEDEELVKLQNPFSTTFPDLSSTVGAPQASETSNFLNMTEDISEEERSYTPCLDERKQEGLEGLDTEMISDEDRNDFDESHEIKTTSDGGDALEINAKESELDFSKPEDFEEGEIIDKLKKAEELRKQKELAEKLAAASESKKDSTKEPSNDYSKKESASSSFKKISRNNKERNYRDKETTSGRSKSRDKDREDKENKKSRKKEKRKEIERYNVRSIIEGRPDKSRRLKDKFGRDVRKSGSRSSRSRSRSPKRRRVVGRSRSRSRQRRHRSRSRSKRRTATSGRKSRDRDRSKKRHRTPSPQPQQQQLPRRRRRLWSRSYSPEIPQPQQQQQQKRLTPSWTPPRIVEPQPSRVNVNPQNLTVILNNDLNKKKKEKRKKDKKKEAEKPKKRKRDKTPPPSKEVFASGNNILVSVSFNKDTGERDITKKRSVNTTETSKKKSKEKHKVSEARKKKKKEMAGVKPVAIIDLDRSPFRELTPSPEDVIVLTDSENNESNDVSEKGVCDSSQQAVTPENSRSTNYPTTGPKTPPEPQVKFTLNPKQNQMRAISNPLREPDEHESEINPEEELEQRLNESLHKGPNTPPEPPNSPPSSPDAYDPFDPTKSRTPTPTNLNVIGENSNHRETEEISSDMNKDTVSSEDKSHTPPVVADVQPADSQSNNLKSNTNLSPSEKKSLSPKSTGDQHINVVINQVVQTTQQPQMVTSTPIGTQSSTSRINILNSTLITAPTVSITPQRSSAISNVSKTSPIKSVGKSVGRKSSNVTQDSEAALDFDSPYSPGSSDYEDLFEPPMEKSGKQNNSNNANNNNNSGGANNSSGSNVAKKSPTKQSNQNQNQSAFDVLFGSSPMNPTFQKGGTNKGKKSSGGNNNGKFKKSGKTKQVGVKIDEDTLKILDELPNSAVEMSVKDRFVDDWVLSVGPKGVCNKEKLQYLKKLNRQERVVEEVKLVLKPHYNKKHINKEEYKDILRRSVPKICHNKSGEINPQKIQNLIEAYVKKIRHNKKVTSSSSTVNPQKA